VSSIDDLRVRTEAVERAILERAAARATQWFPGLGPSPQLTLTPLSIRPRCSLYVVALAGDHVRRAVVAKVRRGEADADPTGGRPQRPRLRKTAAGVAELTALEFEGLTSIYESVPAGHPQFGAVRPLDHMPAESVLLMEHVSAPTLRDGFVAESRLGAVRRLAYRGSSTRPPPQRAWLNAGAWLRSYHDLPPASQGAVSQPARQATSAEVAERFSAYGAFLTERVGSRLVGRLAAGGAEAATEVLPEHLPLAVGHGDYVARNIFVDHGGRVTVFDPMPRWRVPRYEDLCRFLVGLRLSGLQVLSHGSAYGQTGLARRETLFLSGYFGEEAIPYAALRCYQLLILLDKWSALVDSAGGGNGWRAAVRERVRKSGDRYISREAGRVAALLHRS
jgi:hypothetical protein